MKNAVIVGWFAIWVLFVMFNVLFAMNKLEALLWMTLASLPPIWILTVVGGILEIRSLLGRRGRPADNTRGNEGK